MAWREVKTDSDLKKTTLKSKEVIQIPLDELIEVIQTYLRNKTGNKGLMIYKQQTQATTDENNRILGISVSWENTYK